MRLNYYRENIEPKDLLSYFSHRGNRFINAAGMQIGLTEGNYIWTEFNLYNHNQVPIAMDISTESDVPLEFIEGFKLQSLQDIDRLGYTNS